MKLRSIEVVVRTLATSYSVCIYKILSCESENTMQETVVLSAVYIFLRCVLISER